MAVLEQPVTAQRNWLQRHFYTGHWSRCGEGGLTMVLLCTTIHQHDWLVNESAHQTCL